MTMPSTCVLDSWIRMAFLEFDAVWWEMGE
jgi:hypothetical protein